MTFKRDIPDYNESWDDLLYNPGWAYPTQGEREIECTVVSETEVEVANYSMSVSEALHFIEFYNASTNEEGPCGLSRELTFWTGGSDSARVPDHVLERIVTWLKNVLGVEPYDGPADNWEGD